MALYRLYFVVENLAMQPAHWSALLANMHTLGPLQGEANELIQTATSLNGQSAIFEALFDEAKINPNEVRRYVASAAGLNLGQVTQFSDGSVGYTATGRTDHLRYRYQNQDRVRFRVFGGAPRVENTVPRPTYEESLAEVTAYLAANEAAWYDYSGGS